MAESHADKNAESTSSSPIAPDDTIKDLDVRLSEEQMNKVKGGITFTYGHAQVQYKPQKPDGSS